MNKAARNEQVKTTAAWLNGAAIAALAIGCFAPITAYVTGSAPIRLGLLTLLVSCWITISLALHIGARLMLRRIEE